jgi:hypothetical protein
MMKNQFVFKADENRGDNQIEQYEEQVLPFDKKMLNNKNQLINNFLKWSHDTIAAVYDEDWENWEEDDSNILSTLSGQYQSKKYGVFTVEIDTANQIHVFSQKMGTHYLINNSKAFTETIIKKYDLKKIN